MMLRWYRLYNVLAFNSTVEEDDRPVPRYVRCLIYRSFCCCIFADMLSSWFFSRFLSVRKRIRRERYGTGMRK